jgi:hypothetical protein
MLRMRGFGFVVLAGLLLRSLVTLYSQGLSVQMVPLIWIWIRSITLTSCVIRKIILPRINRRIAQSMR